MKEYIEKMDKSLNNKLDLLKESLKLQIYLLDHPGIVVDLSFFEKISIYEKKLLEEDMIFLKNYEKLFDVMRIKSITDLELEYKVLFKPIQEKITVISELEEHFRLQSNMLFEREHRSKNKLINQNKIKAYKK